MEPRTKMIESTRRFVAQAAHDSPWHERRCDSVLWLDSAVSALTLGNEGIIRPQLRVHLQPVSVAAVYILVPRSTSDASCREEKDDGVWESASTGNEPPGYNVFEHDIEVRYNIDSDLESVSDDEECAGLSRYCRRTAELFPPEFHTMLESRGSSRRSALLPRPPAPARRDFPKSRPYTAHT
jgi:hypothetical protein